MSRAIIAVPGWHPGFPEHAWLVAVRPNGGRMRTCAACGYRQFWLRPWGPLPGRWW